MQRENTYLTFARGIFISTVDHPAYSDSGNGRGAWPSV